MICRLIIIVVLITSSSGCSRRNVVINSDNSSLKSSEKTAEKLNDTNNFPRYLKQLGVLNYLGEQKSWEKQDITSTVLKDTKMKNLSLAATSENIKTKINRVALFLETFKEYGDFTSYLKTNDHRLKNSKYLNNSEVRYENLFDVTSLDTPDIAFLPNISEVVNCTGLFLNHDQHKNDKNASLQQEETDLLGQLTNKSYTDYTDLLFKYLLQYQNFEDRINRLPYFHPLLNGSYDPIVLKRYD